MSAASANDGPAVRTAELTVEYAESPLGTDVTRPRLGWVLEGDGHDTAQSAYRVRVDLSEEAAADGTAEVWDSGVVESSRTVGAGYDGPTLEPATRYFWTVEVWDTDGRSTGRSEIAWFETGLRGESAWQAQWIGAAASSGPEVDLAGSSWIFAPGATAEGGPTGDFWLRGELSLPGTEVVSAALAMTADDDFTAYLDGTEALHTDEQTDAWRNAQYADVTGLVAAARERVVVATRVTNRGGAEVNPGGLLGVLSVETADGLTHELRTDADWVVTDTEESGWSEPDHDDAGWDPVEVLAPYGEGPWGDGVTVSVPEPPAPLLRRDFGLDKPVERARLYASGLAFAELWLNGQRVGDSVLDPGFTAYDQTILYATHDVTDLLHRGDNVVGAELGRGFYSMSTPNVWWWEQAPWRTEPRLLLRLVADHPDGTSTVVVSDERWRLTEGPTRTNSHYEGETFDARLVPSGWSEAGFDDTDWSSVTVSDGPGGRLIAQENEPIRATEELPPRWTRLDLDSGTEWVADFESTIAGWVTLRVDAPEGTTIRLTHGERLNDDGTVQAENGLVHSSRYQVDEYIADGSGPAEWTPRFTYKGFRYVQVQGLPDEPGNDTLVAQWLHSDVPRIAEFTCSEVLFETFHAAMAKTIRNNLHGFPTDTPMYEKNGWTGDAQVGAPTMATTFDMSRFFTKWLGDLRDSQVESGQIPVIVPSGGWGYSELAPSPEWTTVYPYLVREMHRWYGDERLLEEHWEPVTAYLDWELDRLEDGLAVTALGDYLSPGHNGIPPEDTRLTASCYLHRALISMAEVGELIGHNDVGQRYRAEASALADRVNETFLDTDAGHYRTEQDPEYRQTSNLVPLAFGITPPEWERSVIESVVADIRSRDTHLNTGNLGTSVLLPTLTRHGYSDVAADVALQTTYPSWGHWFENGADTMWEMWHLDSRSRNHYFQGTVAQWLMEDVAGLCSADDGWRRIRVHPRARARVSSASLSVQTVRGTASSSWRSQGRTLFLDVHVPVGSTAEVHVPGTEAERIAVTPRRLARVDRVEDGHVVFEVGSGEWSFRTTVLGHGQREVDR